MAYADYSYYTGTYKGNVIPQSDFDQKSQRASEYLHYITSGKSTSQLSTYEEQVKMATCAIAEDYYTNDDSDAHIVSESVGGHSVSYDRGVSGDNKIKRNKAKMYLWDTGMLYRGVD